MATDYKIKKGDTLGGIAKSNNTSVDALLKLNPNIKNSNLIYAGQGIKLGSSTPAPAPAPSTSPMTPTVPSPAPTTATPAPTMQATPAPPNAPIGYMEHTKLTDDEMRSKAENTINPLYNEQVEAFNQAAERNRQAYDQALGTRQKLYDTQKAETQELAGQHRQMASDDSLKRGMARSNIATNARERVDAQEAKSIQALQTGLQNDVTNINEQLITLERQLSDSLKRLDVDKAMGIQAKIDELTQQQEDKEFQIQQYNNQLKQYEEGFAYQQQRDSTSDSQRQEQFDYQKERDSLADERWQTEFDWKKAMDQASLDLQRKRASGSGGGGSGSPKSGESDAYSAAYYDIFNSADPYTSLSSVLRKYDMYLSTQEKESLRIQTDEWRKQYGKQTVSRPSSNLSQKSISELQNTKRDTSGGLLGKKPMTY